MEGFLIIAGVIGLVGLIIGLTFFGAWIVDRIVVSYEVERSVDALLNHLKLELGVTRTLTKTKE